MNTRTPLFAGLAACAMLFGSAAVAQQSVASPSSTPTPPPIVTVRSAQPTAPTIAPPPSFQTLSGGSKWITSAQAAAYPPLANDFLNASRGADRINQTQYAAWVKQMK
ncbi:MAG TPA: hypothetical protein VFM52_05885 [Rhodanobacter sp.]|nr:hypothetical protein [Rhodanobacter sp.]